MKKRIEPISKEFTRQEAEEILEQCKAIDESTRKLRIRAKKCLVPIKVVK